MCSLYTSLTVVLLLIPLFAVADPSRDEFAFRFVDDFRDVAHLQSMANVTQRRDSPRIVTRPDVRSTVLSRKIIGTRPPAGLWVAAGSLP